MALRVRWESRTLAVPAAMRCAGIVVVCRRLADAGAGGMLGRSGVLMIGLLPLCGWEALGDQLAEQQEDFPLPQGRQARPKATQRAGRCRDLWARGGTRDRRGLHMTTLLSVGRDVPGTIAAA